MNHAQQAILDRIASGESGGAYDVIYSPQRPLRRFSDFSDHPRVKVPIPGKPGWHSTAAGRYQFLAPTWDLEARRLGLKDFSPESQDSAAWDLASRLYQGHTGRSIERDWAGGRVDWSALAPVWPSVGSSRPAAPTGAKPAPGAPPSYPVLTNPPEMKELLAPEAPGEATAPDAPAPPPEGMSPMMALGLLAPHHAFVPVSYDPWRLAPHLTPVHHDPFNPPGGTGEPEK